MYGNDVSLCGATKGKLVCLAVGQGTVVTAYHTITSFMVEHGLIDLFAYLASYSISVEATQPLPHPSACLWLEMLLIFMQTSIEYAFTSKTYAALWGCAA